MNRAEVEIAHYLKTMPQYREALHFLRKILKFQSSLADKIVACPEERSAALPMDISEAHEILRSGVPLFEKKSVPVSPIMFRNALEELRILLPKEPDGSALDRLLSLDLLTPENVGMVLDELKTSGAPCIKRLAKNASADPDILLFLLRTVLSPFFEYQAGFYRNLVDSHFWRHGMCPICGSAPEMARLAGDDGRRILACSLCHAEWAFDRLRCPFCEYDGSPVVRHFNVEGDKVHRVDCCDACRRYLKVVDERVLGHPASLPVEEVITSHLDRLAEEQGYQ